MEKIKEYLFNTANMGDNISEGYLKQTVKFLDTYKEDEAAALITENKLNLLDFARYIRNNYHDSICDAWARNSDGKLFFNAEDIYEEFLKTI